MTIDRDALVKKTLEHHYSPSLNRCQCGARLPDDAPETTVGHVLDAILPDVRKAALEDELGAIAGLLRGTYSDEPDGHGSGVSPITVALAHIESRLSAIRAAALGDAPRKSSEPTNERDELILTVRDVDADFHGTGPLALSGAEAALIADAVIAAGYRPQEVADASWPVRIQGDRAIRYVRSLHRQIADQDAVIEKAHAVIHGGSAPMAAQILADALTTKEN